MQRYSTRIATAVFAGILFSTSIGIAQQKQPEWPKSLKEGKARIVRLKHESSDWNQDLGKGGDYNLLLWYEKLTNLKIGEPGEFMGASELKRTEKKALPALLIITGRNEVNLNEAEIAALRSFCLEQGGMILADNGGGRFDPEIRSVFRRIFPDSPLQDIPVNDPLFQTPYLLVEGAPALWRHSGQKAQGIKIENRWVAFYHQGDILDAWKDSHSGISEDKAIAAYLTGFNLLHYAYSQRDILAAKPAPAAPAPAPAAAPAPALTPAPAPAAPTTPQATNSLPAK